MEKRLMKYRIVKAVMTAAGVLFPLLVLGVPALDPVRRELFTWILYGICLLLLLFVWGIGAKGHKAPQGGPSDNALLDETTAVLEQRNKWFW